MAVAVAVSVSMGVMKPVLAKLTTLMGDEYKKLKGLRKEVAFLQNELGDMDALLEKMDSADELDPQAKKWRRDIIEMSYNIEDRIDDFMHNVGEVDDKMGILRKASNYVKTFKDRRRLANEFQEIKTLVTEASDRRKRYMLDQCISVTTPVVVDPRVSALYKESASLVGIESQKDELVSWAMDEVKELKFMAIVGFGGIGKTTLANEVYHDARGKFKCKAFISVSQKPQMIAICNSLLSQLGLRTYSHACQLQDPINDIRRHLQDKRYFIVVDDLWESQHWGAIQCAFPQSNHCSSRVIITTRNENVAISCCHNNGCIHNMKHLSDQYSRKLFFDRIFGSEDACPAELKKPSCEILKKCGGLPLAIITMASMLACQTTRQEGQWDYIQNSLATKSTASSNYEEMMYILDLSYKNLPRYLKACFLYIGSYPEDHEIERVDLVRQWVAEGFVSSSTKQDAWNVAESYFNELVNRSMIQPTYKQMQFNIEVSGCRVHDMLLDLILRRCKDDNFLNLVNNAEAMEQVIDQRIRRLTVASLRDGEDDTKLTISMSRNLSHIRSLTILGYYDWTLPLLDMKFLRVLSLQTCYSIVVDLTCINQLSQLRYLNVEGKVMLPCQIRGLQHLETLDLSLSSPLIASNNSTLEIFDLPCLTNLLFPQDGMRLLPDEITKVELMCTLESIIGMGALKNLIGLGFHLRKMCAPLDKARWMAALSTSLEKLCNLRQLDLYYDQVVYCADELSTLSPSFNKLEKLYMCGCIFSRVPKWIGHLHNLRALIIGVKQMGEEDFAVIGTGAPSLLSLDLRITGILTERIVIRGSMGFASVKCFKFNCDCISPMSFEAGAMPELQELKLVFDANKWDKAAPGGLQHLPQLKKIEAERSCDLTVQWRTRRRYPAMNDGDANKAEEELIRRVFQNAANALPTCPMFIFHDGWLGRPIEEEEECSNIWTYVPRGTPVLPKDMRGRQINE